MHYSASHPSRSLRPPLFSLSIICVAVLQITLLLDVLFLHGYLVCSLCFQCIQHTQLGVLELHNLSVFHTSLLIFQYSLKCSKLIFPFFLCSFFSLIFFKDANK